MDSVSSNYTVDESNEDLIIKCAFCNSEYTDPYILSCHHAFCRCCLNANVKAGKIYCILCDREIHLPNSNLEKIIKPSNLSNFLLKFYKKEFDEITISEDEHKEVEGVCLECSPPEPVNSRQVEPQIEPILLKLSMCFHCKKQLCNSCRTKHYNSQRNESLKLLSNYMGGSENIIATSEQLNEARARKIIEYQRAKIDITERRLELVRQLEHEEQNLHRRLDDEAQLETENIEKENTRLKRSVANKEATKSVYNKIKSEKNFKRLTELCVDFLNAQNEWKTQLQNEAARIDPSKERIIAFHPSKIKDDIIGTVEQKKGNLKIQAATIPGEKSSICSLL